MWPTACWRGARRAAKETRQDSVPSANTAFARGQLLVPTPAQRQSGDRSEIEYAPSRLEGRVCALRTLAHPLRRRPRTLPLGQRRGQDSPQPACLREKRLDRVSCRQRTRWLPYVVLYQLLLRSKARTYTASPHCVARTLHTHARSSPSPRAQEAREVSGSGAT